jgi:protease I
MKRGDQDLGNILMMVDNNVEDSEFIYPFYRLQEEGYKVDVVAQRAGEIYTGKHGVPFRSDLSPRDVNLASYDAVVIPGGGAPDRMRVDRGMVKIVEDAFKAGKVIAAVCHGPQMLIEANILRKRRATCWKSVVTDLKNAGADYRDEPAVVDGGIVTSRSPEDLPDFCRELIKLLKDKK